MICTLTLQRSYRWDSSLDDVMKRIWESKLSGRLPDLLYKARMAYKKTRKCPDWISEPHWKAMLEKWEIDASFKKKSEQNSKNRNSDCGGLGPSLHTGGSIPISEHKRKHVRKMSPFDCIFLVLNPLTSIVFSCNMSCVCVVEGIDWH